MNRRKTREVEEIFEQLGATIIHVDPNSGKHAKIYWRSPAGKEHMYVTSRGSKLSDRWTYTRMTADLKRQIREDNLLVADTKGPLVVSKQTKPVPRPEPEPKSASKSGPRCLGCGQRRNLVQILGMDWHGACWRRAMRGAMVVTEECVKRYEPNEP